jgi:hypothetical protein
MKMKHVMRGLAVSVVVLGSTTPSIPADAPNLVGTWKAVADTFAGVRLGPGTEHHQEHKTPTLATPAAAWTIVIEAQEGRTFHGYAMSPQGRKEPLVGVIRQNGRSVLMSQMKGSVQGEFIGNQLELCWTDHLPEVAHIACMLLAKQGS